MPRNPFVPERIIATLRQIEVRVARRKPAAIAIGIVALLGGLVAVRALEAGQASSGNDAEAAEGRNAGDSLAEAGSIRSQSLAARAYLVGNDTTARDPGIDLAFEDLGCHRFKNLLRQ